MLRLMKERDSLGVVADQHGSPTSAADLSAAIVHMLTLPDLPPGIYHYTNAGATTWYHFACEIHRLGRQRGLLQRDCTINPLTTAQYPTKAARPAYSVLSKEKIQTLGVQVPEWEGSLAVHLEEIGAILRRQRIWFGHVDYDLATARHDLAGNRKLSALFWCQQSLEKCLKALLEFWERPKPIHDLLKIASYLRLELTKEQRRFITDLVEWYRSSRYDVDIADIDAQLTIDDVAGIVGQTEEMVQWLRTKNRLPLG
jgi:HEPN domain-containing protein